MMHVDDIERALDERRFPEIEAAFRHLVQWPEEDAVRGADDADELGRLLDRVTAALEADKQEMPEHLVRSILERSGDGMWLRDDRSFAAGARAVAARAVKWRLMFAARLGPEDQDPSECDPYVTS